MTKCPSCSQAIPDDRQSCPSCGTALEDSFTPTRLFTDESHGATSGKEPSARKGATRTTSRPSRSFNSIDNARFVPGTILAERYRITGLLGQGGMGEVYRADDLKLGQAVALKFLPESLSTDGAALARFHREVRVARQVSHRNVCRVYDISEVDGQQFLSMEFIKGEELSSLLRRIGRLPADKALDVARQLCAGLSAAHEGGVLHRDLKPANVMIDGDGNVRILDFGLAGLVEEFGDEEIRAGTPAYMAPEQLAGEELTTRTDIYSLGLVLYEVFTGKRAFEATSLAELIRLRKSAQTPASLSSVVRDVDSQVERVILRCLERDPERRPASALQVAAQLPGGDPLAAALAAGETPSPEMVAGARKIGSLKPAVAAPLLVFVLLSLISALFLSPRMNIQGFVPLEKSPDVLQDRAREIIRRAGYAEAPADSAYGFGYLDGYLDYVKKNDGSSNRWQQLSVGQPSAMLFRYRQSPQYLVPRRRTVSADDPPKLTSGMTGVSLDTRGRLVYFYSVPQQIEEGAAEKTEAPNWAALFTEAGLDINQFKAAESRWVPATYSDTRAAWDGTFPDRTQVPIHVEAAGYRGKPVYFEIIVPWDTPTRQVPQQASLTERVFQAVTVTLLLSVLVAGALLAWRNLKLGRGDRRGAFRLALFNFAVGMIEWVFFSAHVPALEPELALFIDWFARSLLQASVFWLLYMALEPFIRRRWPHRIISWSRLLAGDVRDPLIGKDILVGAAFGVGIGLLSYLWYELPRLLGMPPRQPLLLPPRLFESARGLAEGIVGISDGTLMTGFSMIFVFLLLSILLRKEWLANVLLGLCVTVLWTLPGEYPAIDVAVAAVTSAILVFVLRRYGLLSLMATIVFYILLTGLPYTTNLSAWYATNALIILGLGGALAVYGFYTSLAGQRLFRGGFLQD
jgi:serine/threonine protein kinase